ncbi:MAG: hypothetical protein ACK4MF_02440 [Hyphomicrobiaceae bacterium]
MTRPDDETLMAFADGALSPERHAEVAAYLATDADARALVDDFRRSADLVRGAFDAALTAPPNEKLEQLIRSGGASGTAAANVTSLASRRKVPFRSQGWQPLALAASLALVIGAGLGWLANSGGGRGAGAGYEVAIGPVPGASDLGRLLETRPSYDEVVTGEGASRRRLVVVATFRDRAARPCREFEVTSVDQDQRPIGIGVACRTPSGAWAVEGLAQPIVAEVASNGAMKPASGMQEAPVMEGFMRMLGAQPVVAADEEQQLLARGWK